MLGRGWSPTAMISVATFEETVERYCELVASWPATCDYQALYDKVKAAQQLYIVQKNELRQTLSPLDYDEMTRDARMRFKAAHARMRVVEVDLRERGVKIQPPDERARDIRFVVPAVAPRDCCVVS
jgi:hypothetical protein